MSALTVFLYGEGDVVEKLVDRLARKSPLLSGTFRHVDVVRAYEDGETYGLDTVKAAFVQPSCRMSAEALGLFVTGDALLVVFGVAVPKTGFEGEGSTTLSHQCQISGSVHAGQDGKHVILDKNRAGEVGKFTWNQFSNSLHNLWLPRWSE